jgi:hemerythrin-like domain-containing protein
MMGGDTDAISLLKEDHKNVKELFKEYEKIDPSPGTAEARHQLANKIIEELVVHSWLEEKYFYPKALASTPKAEGVTRESLEEHQIVERTAAELGDLPPTDPQYDAKMRVMIENVRNHIKEEEGDLFPEVKKTLDKELLKELGREMASAKPQAPRKPQLGGVPPPGAAKPSTGGLP